MGGKVLLTGISGFLGGHVAMALLDKGYHVRGSVRSLDKAERVRQTLSAAGADIGRLEFVALDLLDDAGWSEAAQGCRFLAHTASPFVLVMPKDKNELIRPAVEGTRRAIAAGLAAGVERIVLTSSIAAIQYGHPSRTAPFTEADWSLLEGGDVTAYTESKTRAEREAWSLMDAAGRHDDLVTINPSAILGPLLDDDPGTSGALVLRLLKGSVPAAPRLHFGIVDVRDVALMHVAGFERPDAGGQRFIASDATLSLMELANALRTAFPHYAGRLPRFELPDWLVRIYGLFDADVRGNLASLGLVRHLDNARGAALLGHGFTPARDAVIATGHSLVAQHLL